MNEGVQQQTSVCPVSELSQFLKDALSGGGLSHPKSRRIADEVLDLVEDIAWGRAGEDHLPAVSSLLTELSGIHADPQAESVAKRARSKVSEHSEVFVSHVETRNCTVGSCLKLAPAPCQMACPAGIDVPTYVSLIGQGKYAEAIDIIRRDNPFPWVCGLVCTRPCEFMCVRGRIDKPVAIKPLKGFAAERAMADSIYTNPTPEPPKHKKVCIIGAGPGGMSCAYYLALKGYGVRVIEALPMAGGMIMVGIPRYRLPRAVIDREVGMLAELGVEFQFNTRFGTDVTLSDLKKDGYEAFFFAIGAHKAYSLGIAGENEYGVTEAIDLLRQVALGDRRKPGDKVVVIGGGNVAIDAARTCLRLGSREVTIAYRRTRNEMPADVEEVEHAEEEGVRMAFLTIPEGIIGKAGKTTGMQCCRAQLVKREGSNRMSPVPIEKGQFIMDADVVVAAIGQQVDNQSLSDLSDIRWTRRNTIEINRISMQTSMDGVFSAGDAVTGPATVIEAIGGGKRAALSIDRYLNGLPQPKMPPVPARRGNIDCARTTATDKMIAKRPGMPMAKMDRRRTTFQQVELGFSENDARTEAERCLRCDICRRCGDCVRICRDKMNVDALQMGYLEFDNPVETDFRLTRERCILCGACATNCPNGAMTIEDIDGYRILSLCGTELNRQKILYCQTCGKDIGTRRYRTYIHQRVNTLENIWQHENLCDACLRKRGVTTTSAIGQ